jgi:hypothetical protein
LLKNEGTQLSDSCENIEKLNSFDLKGARHSCKRIHKRSDGQGRLFLDYSSTEKGIIAVEHYSYDNGLLRIIEGKNVRGIY